MHHTHNNYTLDHINTMYNNACALLMHIFIQHACGYSNKDAPNIIALGNSKVGLSHLIHLQPTVQLLTTV